MTWMASGTTAPTSGCRVGRAVPRNRSKNFEVHDRQPASDLLGMHKTQHTQTRIRLAAGLVFALLATMLAATSAGAVRLNDDLATPVIDDTDVIDFQVAANGSRVVYRAEQEAENRFDLYSVPATGGTPVRLNGALPNGGDVLASFQISADSSTVVYIADQDADDVFELYAVPITGGTPTKLNGVLGCCNDVADFVISPDSSRVLYRSDEDLSGVLELHSVTIDGASSVKIHTDLTLGDQLGDDYLVTADSSRVVYRVRTTGSGANLYSAPVAGGAIEHHSDFIDTEDHVERFVISPDSASVVFDVEDEFITLWADDVAG